MFRKLLSLLLLVAFLCLLSACDKCFPDCEWSVPACSDTITEWCDPNTTNSDQIIDNSVILLSKNNSVKTTCDGICVGYGWYAKNNSGKRVLVKLKKTYYQIVGGKSDVEFESIILKPKENKYLGCGPRSSDGLLHSCDWDLKYDVVDVEIALMVDYETKPILLASLDDQTNKVILQSIIGYTLNCLKECEESNETAYCFTIDAKLANEEKNKQHFNFSNSFSGLYDLLGDKHVDISKNTLLSLFNGVDYPGRSGIKINNGILTNQGSQIEYLYVKLSIVGAVEEVFVFLPKLIEGEINNEGSRYIVSFYNPNSSGMVKFNNPELQNDWGGVVQQVALSKGELMIGTKNGCISIIF